MFFSLSLFAFDVLSLSQRQTETDRDRQKQTERDKILRREFIFFYVGFIAFSPNLNIDFSAVNNCQS